MSWLNKYWRNISLWALAVPAIAVAAEVRALGDGRELRLEISFPEQVSIQPRADEREILIEFSCPLNWDSANPPALPDWVESFSAAYDSAVLRTSRLSRFDATVVYGTTVVITAVPLPIIESEAERRESALRLKLLRVQLAAARGDLAGALRLGRALESRNPANATVLAALAAIEQQVGRTRQAKDLYQKAVRAEPDREEWQDALEGLRSSRPDFVRSEVDWKTVGPQWRERILRTTAERALGSSWRSGLSYDRNQAEVGSVLTGSGTFTGFRGSRQRGELWLERENYSGPLRLSLFGGGSSAGVGAAWTAIDTQGRTKVQFDWRRPYWEFIESVAGNGVRNRMEIERQQRFGRRMAAWATAGWNRYGLAGTPTAAKSVGLSGGLAYSVLARRPQVALQYGFDTERSLYRATKTGPGGQPFHPLPLVSREVHAFSVAAAGTLREFTNYDATAGYAVDRLGGKGPFFSARLTYGRWRRLRPEVWFDHRLNTINTLAERVNRVAGGLVWVF